MLLLPHVYIKNRIHHNTLIVLKNISESDLSVQLYNLTEVAGFNPKGFVELITKKPSSAVLVKDIVPRIFAKPDEHFIIRCHIWKA